MTILLASIAASRSMLLEGEDLRSTSGALGSTTATGAVRSGSLRKRWAWVRRKRWAWMSELLYPQSIRYMWWQTKGSPGLWTRYGRVISRDDCSRPSQESLARERLAQEATPG